MIVSLQYLRAIAAMMVVAFHAAEKLGHLYGVEGTVKFPVGLAGVDIFFVISGFIIFTTAERSGATPASFLRKRVIRIVPLYWGLTLLLAAVALVRPELLATSVFDLSHFVASLLFLPWQHPYIPASLPLLVPGWTLNYEMAFYTLFAAGLFLPRAIRLSALVAVLCLLAAIGQLLPTSGIAAFYTDQIILEFAAGMLLARYWLSGGKVPLPAALGLLVGGSILLLFGAGSDLPRAIGAGIPAVMIVAGAVWAESAIARRPVRALVLMGDASYSTYLSHSIAIAVIAKLWTVAGLGGAGTDGIAFLAATLLASTASGILLYQVLEVPLLRWLRGGRDRSQKSGEASTATSPGPQPEARSSALVRL